MSILSEIITLIPGQMPIEPRGSTWSVGRKTNGYHDQRFQVNLDLGNGSHMTQDILERSSNRSYTVDDPKDLRWKYIRKAALALLASFERDRDREVRRARGLRYVKTYN